MVAGIPFFSSRQDPNWIFYVPGEMKESLDCMKDPNGSVQTESFAQNKVKQRRSSKRFYAPHDINEQNHVKTSIEHSFGPEKINRQLECAASRGRIAITTSHKSSSTSATCSLSEETDQHEIIEVRTLATVDSLEDIEPEKEKFKFGTFVHVLTCPTRKKEQSPVKILAGLPLPVPQKINVSSTRPSKRRSRLQHNFKEIKQDFCGHSGEEPIPSITARLRKKVKDQRVESVIDGIHSMASLALEKGITNIISTAENSMKTNSLPLKHGIIGQHLKVAYKKKLCRRLKTTEQSEKNDITMASPHHPVQISMPQLGNLAFAVDKLQRSKEASANIDLFVKPSLLSNHEKPSDKSEPKTRVSVPDNSLFQTAAYYQQHDLALCQSSSFMGEHQVMGTEGFDSNSGLRLVLNPSLMKSLLTMLPFGCSEDNFWLRYSLARDGAGFETMLEKVYNSARTILVIETTKGEVFGSFTSEPWRIQPLFFGSGESFLWRLKDAHSISSDNSQKCDNDIVVYLFTGVDRYIQRCTCDKLWIGGGLWKRGECPFEDEPEGVGLSIDRDLQTGSSGSCATFSNCSLSKLGTGENSTGSAGNFDILNLELWTMSPFYPESRAKAAEARKLFIEQNSSRTL